MGWAIMLEGHTDRAGILLISEDRQEAENIAWEMRRRGQSVQVRPYRERKNDTILIEPTPPDQG